MSEPVAEPDHAEEFPNATPRPWYFDGWDIFTSSSSAGPRGDGHRLVIPLKAINDTFHPSQRVSDDDARLIVQAVNERQQLLEVVTEYAEHGSWRCTYRTRYGKCLCGLDERLAALGLPPVDVYDPEAR